MFIDIMLRILVIIVKIWYGFGNFSFIISFLINIGCINSLVNKFDMVRLKYRVLDVVCSWKVCFRVSKIMIFLNIFMRDRFEIMVVLIKIEVLMNVGSWCDCELY